MQARLEGWVREVLPDLAGRVVVALLILLVAWLVGKLAARAVQRLLERERGGTLVPVARGLVKAVILGVGGVMALDQVGVDIAAVLAGVGVLGLAVGFGAQSLVKDVISGFFLLFDDVLRAGDVADVGPATGVVEEVGLRLTQVRSLNGQLWYVPNGDIGRVGNFNRGWTRALVEVGVAYEGDVRQGMAVLQQVAAQWAEERTDLVLEPPEVQGVLGLNASDVGLRLLVKVKPMSQWEAERELRRRIKEAFDAQGVEIPFPRRVLYLRQDAEAPPPGGAPATA